MLKDVFSGTTFSVACTVSPVAMIGLRSSEINKSFAKFAKRSSRILRSVLPATIAKPDKGAPLLILGRSQRRSRHFDEGWLYQIGLAIIARGAPGNYVGRRSIIR